MHDKKSICFLGNFSAGGTESATFLLANELCEEYQIGVVNSRKGYKPFFPLDSKINYSCLEGKSIISKNFEFFRFLRKNGVDVVISVEAMHGVLSLFSTKLAGRKHIIWEHANYFQNQGVSWIQTMRRLDLNVADAYVVLTKRDRKNFQEHFRIKKPLTQVYNIAQTSSRNVEYDANSKTIVSAGHLRPIKNFQIIPDVARIVFERRPDWKWKIYGSGFEEEAIREKISRFGLENHVLLCGRTKDMDSAYREAAIYVMTSRQEGLPMVLLEAKARKLPIVSFDIETGPDEIIRNGINGYLVPPYDVEIMAERIGDLISDSTKRLAFSDAASLDLELFDAKRIAAQWRELIESL